MKKYISILLIVIINFCSICGCNTSKESYQSYDAKINYKKVPYYGFEIDEESNLLDNAYVEKVKQSYKYDEKSKFLYRDYLEGVEIVKCNAMNNIIKIPQKIEGKNVLKLSGYIDTENFGEPEYDIALTSCFISYSYSIIDEIYIPKTVKEIIKDTFENIENLKRIDVDKENPYYSSKKGILYDKSGKIKLCVPNNYEKKRVE